jgi:endonuclease YncB( thermonuclease family)
MRRALFALAVLALVAAGTLRAPDGPQGAARVIDGDTLAIGGTTVRLHGIDAPERGQACDRAGQAWDCGAFAARVMADLIGGRPVTCDPPRDTDRHGRSVARCRAGGTDLGAAMVAAGAATAYRRYSTAYVAAEDRARAAGRGIWAARMVTPEAHRHSGTPPRPAEGCTIKGNIGTGGRIYHMPGDRHYAQTRITRPGEAWFCSAAEAEAAGFRRSKV